MKKIILVAAILTQIVTAAAAIHYRSQAIESEQNQAKAEGYLSMAVAEQEDSEMFYNAEICDQANEIQELKRWPKNQRLDCTKFKLTQKEVAAKPAPVECDSDADCCAKNPTLCDGNPY